MSEEELSDSGSGSEEEEEEITDLRNSDVVTKYQEAAKIVNLTFRGVAGKCVAGADVVYLCNLGDQLIEKQCQRIFKSNKLLEKGLAFPTCISVNNIVCHFSPLEDATMALKEGDVVKIDLAAHIDGYIATAAHTIVVGQTEPVTGRTADVLAALDVAQGVVQRLCVHGASNNALTTALKQVAADFGVSLVQGVLSHQLKRFVIDGNKVVIGREEVDQKVEEIKFETNEVYGLDIVFSTGEGKPRESEMRTTVFKRALEVQYKLKRKSSRTLFGKVNAKYPTLPFTLRAIDDQTQAKAGIIECVKSELLTEYPVLVERGDAIVGHSKMTVLLMPSGTAKITGNDFPATPYKTEKEPSEAIKAILAKSVGKKKRKKKKKKKSGGGGGGGGGAAAPKEEPVPNP